MLIRVHAVAIIFVLLPSFLISHPAAARAQKKPVIEKKVFRWVDESGKTYLSDQVPAEHAQYRRELLNTKGVVIGVREEAKTKEQNALDKRIKNRIKAREKFIAKQMDHDKVLLSTYRSVDDLNSARDNKMHIFDANIKLLTKSATESEIRMERGLKLAADYERNGEKVSRALSEEVKSVKTQLEDIKEKIDKQREYKEIAKAEFEKDLQRYQFLTRSNPEESLKLSEETSEILAADTLGLFQCGENSECEKAWKIARQFVNAYSTMPVKMENEKVVMTAEPAQDTDVSLSISKMSLKSDKQYIFLDIRCRQSSAGEELCASQKVNKMRTSFRSYIDSAVNGASD